LRLALNALAKTYQLPLAYSGPMFKKLTKQGNTLRIYFDHIEGKLECRGEKLLGFAVAGTNRKFFWADAVIEDDCVVVTAPEVSAPEFVRYAWADNPDCNLYNAAGLPACPFRSDKP
jgi:sialate O-acetylesterase